MTFKTITQTSESLFKDRGSKFLGYAFPCDSEEDFKQFLQQLKDEHKGAVHWCSASRIGFPHTIDRSSDDGEPSGSAGKPILNQLLSTEVVNCAVIVVRYYGGTKLGVSGLIQAYKEAAAMALETATFKEDFIKSTFRLQFPYHISGEVESLLRQFDAEIVKKEFLTDCEFFVKINSEKRLDFSKTNEHLHLLTIKEIDS